MAIRFNTLLKKPPLWFGPGEDKDDVVICSMARSVFNLPDHPFPGWSTSEDRAKVAAKLLPVLRSCPEFKTCHFAEMVDLSQEQRLVLLERELITRSMAARQDGCHLLISKDQKLFAMVNEEEHLCLHVSTAGLDYKPLYLRLASIFNHMSDKGLVFAENATDGCLTSIPSESGAGLQLSALLHLPGLTLAGQMEKVHRAVEALPFSLVSLYQDSGDDTGNLYILHTPSIAKGGASAAAEQFSEFCTSLAKKELRAREQAVSTDDFKLEMVDTVYRSYGLLRYATTMDYKELLNALSVIRLGLYHKILFDSRSAGKGGSTLAALYELAPAHLQARTTGLRDAMHARAVRAQEVRTAMNLLIPTLYI